MDNYYEKLISKHIGSGVVVDANLMFLLVAGYVQSSNVKFNPSAYGNFIEGDFELLNLVLERFNQVIITPK